MGRAKSVRRGDDLTYQRYWDGGGSETRVLGSNDEAYKYYMGLAENLDVSTKKIQRHFIPDQEIES